MRRLIKSTEINEGNRVIVLFPMIINFLLGIVESFLLIRIALKLFGANAKNMFVDFIYSVSAFFARPFINIFNNIEIRENMILEINIIIAVIVYAVIAWLILSIFTNISNRKVKKETIDIVKE
jgi:accessory gene regulator protein AgrB